LSAPWEPKTINPEIGSAKSMLNGGLLNFDGEWATLHGERGRKFAKEQYMSVASQVLGDGFNI